MWLRVISFCAGVMLLLGMLALYQELNMIGFPDGYVTDYDRAFESLVHQLFLPCLLIALHFCYLGWIGGRRSIGRRLLIVGVLGAALLGYGVCSGQRLWHTLDHGQGG